MMKSMLTIATLTGISLLTASPALAGKTVPVPMLAAGAPALAVFAGGYFLIRRFRRG